MAYTLEQLKALGAQPVQTKSYTLDELLAMKAVPVTPAPEAEKKGLIGGIKDAFTKRTQAASEAQTKAIEGKQSIISGALQTFGQGAGLVGDVAMEGIKAIVPDSIEKEIGQNIKEGNWIGGNVLKSDTVQGVAEKYSAWKETHPEAAANLESIVNIASLLPVGKVGQVAVKSAEKGLSRAVKTGSEILASQADRKIVSAFDDALEVVRPALTPTEKELALKQGRVKTEGIFRQTRVTPDINEQRVAEAIQPLVREGRVAKNALPEKNIEEISREVSRVNSDVKNFIADKSMPIRKDLLRQKLESVKKDSSVVFASDPTLENTYDALVNTFMQNMEKGTTLSLFEARQTFDKLPAVKKLLDGVQGATGENLKRQAILDIRRAANEYVADLIDVPVEARALKLLQPKEAKGLVERAKKFAKIEDFVRDQKAFLSKKRNFTKPSDWKTSVEDDLREIWNSANTKVQSTASKLIKDQLRRETYMMQAIDNIAGANRSRIDTNFLQRIYKKNPWLKVALPSGVAGGVITGSLLD